MTMVKGLAEVERRYAVKADAFRSRHEWTGHDGVPVWLVEVPAIWLPGSQSDMGCGRLWTRVSRPDEPVLDDLTGAGWTCVGTILDITPTPDWPTDVGDDVPDGWTGWYRIEQAAARRADNHR